MMLRFFIIFSILFLLSANLFADESNSESAKAITTKEIQYQVGETQLTGYLAFDSAITVKRPGVLVIHEWWGHNQYARKRAVMLAELGYVAFAVDMYGHGKLAQHPKDAGKFMREVTSYMPLAEKRMVAALQILNEQSITDTSKTAAIGYCFGGGMVLHLARTGADIDGVVSFHGSLGTQSPAKIDYVKAKVLVLHGEDDPFIPIEEVQAFKEEMQNAEVEFEFIAYPGVKHSFTNPQADEFREKFDLPALEYNQYADEDSWKQMQSFFEEIFN